jgi:hypothetical protein
MSAKAALSSNGPGAQNTREARRQRRGTNNKKK